MKPTTIKADLASLPGDLLALLIAASLKEASLA